MTRPGFSRFKTLVRSPYFNSCAFSGFRHSGKDENTTADHTAVMKTELSKESRTRRSSNYTGHSSIADDWLMNSSFWMTCWRHSHALKCDNQIQSATDSLTSYSALHRFHIYRVTYFTEVVVVPSPPIDSIWAMVFVWRIIGKISSRL